jgi:SAM-dependent methyltransferase
VSSTFGAYSSYYDLLYRDKDYAGEATYISRLVSEHSSGKAFSLLELGCGTGMHACLLAGQGLVVHGVDASQSMLTAAGARVAANAALTKRVSFQRGDVRSIRTGSRYDAVASLFHVVSYQTADEDLNAIIATAAEHLNQGGVFLFDFWYGPAVLWLRPSVRVKRFSDERISLTRLAEPAMRDAANVVDVHYTVFVESGADASISKILETHCMRYLFLPEVDQLLAAHGFVRERAEEWLTGATPSTDTWSVCVVARKI